MPIQYTFQGAFNHGQISVWGFCFLPKHFSRQLKTVVYNIIILYTNPLLSQLNFGLHFYSHWYLNLIPVYHLIV